jgi:hypothetical protein
MNSYSFRNLLHYPPGRVGRAIEPLLDPLALPAQDLVEPLPDVAEDVAQVVALQLLLALSPQPLEHLLEARQPASLRVAEAAAEQPVERVLEVGPLEEVFGEAVEELLRVPPEWLLGPVPALIALDHGADAGFIG